VRLSTRTAPVEPLETPATGERGTVLLATFDVPFDEAAAGFAVDAAVDSGGALIVANVVELPPLPLSVIMGYDMLDYSEEMAPPSSVLCSGRRRSASPSSDPSEELRRTEALVEVAKEREVRMLVLGPDRQKVSPRLYKRAAGQSATGSTVSSGSAGRSRWPDAPRCRGSHVAYFLVSRRARKSSSPASCNRRPATAEERMPRPFESLPAGGSASKRDAAVRGSSECRHPSCD